MDEKYTSSVFKEWIKNHETKDYQIIENNQDCIELNTDYGKAEIHFTDVTEGTIVEFNIVSYKDQEVKFYLHFELNDEDHAHQLYDEMVETLIELKNKKILKELILQIDDFLGFKKIFRKKVRNGIDFHFRTERCNFFLKISSF